ncbi:MAG: heavy metal translocating P-type ATPase [Clostridia bacterium]|nr:heavy metal translocating P-type ATPase [Clostridia bacterium]
MREEVFDIGGMHCAACSAAVERVTRKLPGVEESSVNLTTEKLTIKYDESQTTREMIIKKIEKAGFTAVIHVDKKTKSELSGNGKLVRLIISSGFAALLLIVSMGHMLFPDVPLPDFISPQINPLNFALLQMFLAIPVIILGYEFFTNGIGSLFHGNPNMNTLVALSSAASFIYSTVMTFLIVRRPEYVHQLYFESSAVVIALVSVGKYLETKSTEITRSAITKLMKLSPDTAVLVTDEGNREINTADVNTGDILLVRAGEHIPLDGIIEKGTGSADEAMVTGESMPIGKEAGDTVIGGSTLIEGAICIRVTKTGNDTTLAKIIKFVEDAQGKKAPISKTADKVAGVFVPIVICISTVSAVVWLILGKDITFALRIFTSVLVIACPCAMGLATPTAIMAGTGLGASRGILVRSGEALEILHGVNVAVFDKTGTITEGKPSLTDIFCAEGVGRTELYRMLYSFETLSEHPIAKAVCSSQEAAYITDIPEITDLRSIAGKGLLGNYEGNCVAVGNEALLKEINADSTKMSDKARQFREEGKTVVYISRDGEVIGLAAVADSIREGVFDMIGQLKKHGITPVLLTGDNAAVAGRIAAEAGIEEVIAEVLPDEKANVVSERKKTGTIVMMVGDGINDAPALAEADIGIAVGNGSDIAIDSADIVLMRNDAEDVFRAIKLGKLTIRNIKQNLFWAFCYNVIAIPVAAGVLYPAFGLLLTPMIGGLAMSLSSLFVVTNALRLGRLKL